MRQLSMTGRDYRRLGLLACVSSAALGFMGAATAAEHTTALKNGTIGYVLTDLFWSVYQTPTAKEECPEGFNLGPREQFGLLFPASKKRTVLDTHLKYELDTWHPTSDPDPLPFHEVQGKFSYGMNLDGKIDDNDFVHPVSGEQGIDNQVYRAVGCIIGFRGPDGVEYIFQNKGIATGRFNRTMIEVSGVDSLTNDDSVQVTIYRGIDRLLTDATGNTIMPGGSQRIDTRWGSKIVRQMAGQIVDGVLTTEPILDVVIPWQNLGVPSIQLIRDFRMQLKLSDDRAEGLVAGYADVDTYYTQLLRNDSTHHLADGQTSGISLRKSLGRLADAYPDPQTGDNTAISTALDSKWVQVYIQHPDGDEAKAQFTKNALEQVEQDRIARSNASNDTHRQASGSKAASVPTAR